jgi:hypothetical protein
MVVHEGAFSCPAAQSSSKADNRQKQSVNSHKSLSIKDLRQLFLRMRMFQRRHFRRMRAAKLTARFDA